MVQGRTMAGRTKSLVAAALVVLLAGCTNIDIVRDRDPGLTCEHLKKEMDSVVWEGLFTTLDNPFNLMLGSSQIHEAVAEREAHLRKIAQEKGCAFVDRVPIPTSTSGA